MDPLATSVLLAVALAAFAFTMVRRFTPLFALRRENRADRARERVLGLLRFGLGQRRLVDPEARGAGLLHVVLFAAFLVLALRTLTLFGMGFSTGFHLPLLAPNSGLGSAYRTLKDIMVLGALIASLAFLWRRLISPPDRLTLSFEGNLILVFIAGLMVTDLLFDGAGMLADSELPTWHAPASSLAAFVLGASGLSPATLRVLGQVGFWAHLAIILTFLNFLPYGKHFHILTALPDVYCRALAPGSAALRKLDLESETTQFGAQTVRDLSWKEALDIYSCTECGRCQTHCPTYVTGKPLSHKEVNRALRRHLGDVATELTVLAREKDLAAREEISSKLPPISSAVVPPETFWACTTCGWCETACPLFIENIPRLVDLRRHKVLVESDFPEEAARVFKNIETQGNPWGLGSNRRTEWCEDLDIKRASDGKGFEYLFFVGCAGAFDDRQKKVSRAIVKLLREASVSFAILGEEETCHAEAARRLGNEYLFQMQAAASVEKLNGYGVKKVLVQCPHCLNTLKNELPQFGGHYQVIHHTELISELVSSGRLRRAALAPGEGLPVTFHDPCYLARHNGVEEAPRAALAAAGVRLAEMPRRGRQGFCCGAGGGRMWLEEKLGTRVNQHRVAEAAATLGERGGVLAVGCPFCHTMLRDGVNETGREERLRVMDVAEIVAGALAKGS